MPSYNSVFRYLEAEALTPYLYELIATSALPLKSVEHDFAVDSSGFSTGQFMRWFDVKYGKEEDKAIPYIPFKINSKSQTSYGPKSTLWTRMLEFYNDNREEFLSHYHQRSNVETTFHMIKSKFGQRLRSKTLTG